MDKLGKRLLAVVLATGLLVGGMGMLGAVPVMAAQTGDDGTTNWDFIVPVTHQKTVPSGYTGINTAQQLSNIRNNLSGNFIMMNDIDLTGWGNWVPIGALSGAFTGTLDGNGYAIKNLSINANSSDETAYYGLFGYISGYVVNVGLTNSNIIVNGTANVIYAGAIAAMSKNVRNCFVGGNSKISASTSSIYRNIPPSGQVYVGGLVGRTNAGAQSASTYNCYNSSTVEGRAAYAYAGGIAGNHSGDRISSSFNTGNVIATTNRYDIENSPGFAAAGGIVSLGQSAYGCFNLGSIKSIGLDFSNDITRTGGVIAQASGSYVTTCCYNQGAISANTKSSYAGGIVGSSDGSLLDCYNSGNIEGQTIGALISTYYGNGTFKNCYFINNSINAIGSWDERYSKPVFTSVLPLTDVQMRQQASFVGFDFDTVWQMPAGGGYPVLRGMPGAGPVDPPDPDPTEPPEGATVIEHPATTVKVGERLLSFFDSTDSGFKGRWTYPAGTEQYITLTVNNHTSGILQGTQTVWVDGLKEGNAAVYCHLDSGVWHKYPIQVVSEEIDPALDSDGDGLLDVWELGLVDIDGDGTIDTLLKDMGADPSKSDIFVEVDWMKGFAPPTEALDIVVESFFNSGAGYQNKGINLHVVLGQEIPHKSIIHLGGANDEFMPIQDQYFNDALRGETFRYCLFVDRFYDPETGNTNTSGICGGQQFIVAQGVLQGRQQKIAGTFMHELGHSLGLGHGGHDDVNYKPNYLSVMNYLFQFSGLVGTNAIDYSHQSLPVLNEATIYEFDGIDPEGLTNGSGLGTKLPSKNGLAWSLLKATIDVSDVSKKAIDFNQDGVIDANPIAVDINKDGSFNLVMPGHNDWDNLKLDYWGRSGAGSAVLVAMTPPDWHLHPETITLEEAQQMGLWENDYENALPLIFDVPSTLAITNAPASLQYKQSITLTASEVVTWSNDSKAVKVNSQTGKVESVSVFGFTKSSTAKITATSTDGNRTASVTIQIKPAWWQWLIIIPLFGWIWY